mmetsp:Transcript_8503/g.21309  ORF Transcript_8503/g.21309 Transcript_8503/m.21309 type:complete len:466 (-) Transcript_8503:2480-3877(-)
MRQQQGGLPIRGVQQGDALQTVRRGHIPLHTPTGEPPDCVRAQAPIQPLGLAVVRALQALVDIHREQKVRVGAGSGEHEPPVLLQATHGAEHTLAALLLVHAGHGVAVHTEDDEGVRRGDGGCVNLQGDGAGAGAGSGGAGEDFHADGIGDPGLETADGGVDLSEVVHGPSIHRRGQTDQHLVDGASRFKETHTPALRGWSEDLLSKIVQGQVNCRFCSVVGHQDLRELGELIEITIASAALCRPLLAPHPVVHVPEAAQALRAASSTPQQLQLVLKAARRQHACCQRRALGLASADASQAGPTGGKHWGELQGDRVQAGMRLLRFVLGVAQASVGPGVGACDQLIRVRREQLRELHTRPLLGRCQVEVPGKCDAEPVIDTGFHTLLQRTLHRLGAQPSWERPVGDIHPARHAVSTTEIPLSSCGTVNPRVGGTGRNFEKWLHMLLQPSSSHRLGAIREGAKHIF